MNELDLLFQMMFIRAFEEKAAELYTQQKIRGFLHLYIGEEAIAVGSMQAFKDEDNIVATYREHGHAIARGISAESVMLEMFAKQEGCSRGRGGSMHLFDAKTNFYGGNAIVAGGVPLAVGLALASKMQNQNKVTACYFGDGAMGEGALHESANIAALWELPVLMICENNFYAMGTKISDHQSQTALAEKARSYKIQAKTVDGMDVLAVKKATEEAVAYIRSGKGPYFLEVETYRFRAHSMYDPELYRDEQEVNSWKKRDPIKTFSEKLIKQKKLSTKELNNLQKRAEKEVDKAIEQAEKGTLEPVEDLMNYVYAKDV
jgi:pyruvate dehydrogenase E1 component subunit alpha